jgi:DNA primase
MQRIDAVESPEDYNRAFADLLALEEYRRSLRQESLGTGA